MLSVIIGLACGAYIASPLHAPQLERTKRQGAITMGLDADFLIEVGYGAKSEWSLHVVELRKHNHIHGYMCELSRGEADEWRGEAHIELSVDQLKELELKLKQWAKDPDAMKSCPDKWWGPFFGTRPGTPGYEERVAYRRQKAPAIAKKIRKMWTYIEKQKKTRAPGDLSQPFVHGVYHASW